MTRWRADGGRWSRAAARSGSASTHRSARPTSARFPNPKTFQTPGVPSGKSNQMFRRPSSGGSAASAGSSMSTTSSPVMLMFSVTRVRGRRQCALVSRRPAEMSGMARNVVTMNDIVAT